MLTRINDAIARAFLYAAAVLAFLLCFLVVADVLGRVVFNSPVKGTPEIVSTSIVIICFMQAGYAIRSGGMLNVDALVKHLPPGAQSWMAALGALLGAAFFAFLCWGSLEPALHAWASNEFEGEGALRVPAWPTRYALVIGTALATTSYLVTLAGHVRDALTGEPPPSSQASH
ncbi:MAG: TRAP transporter small permease [Gammaproteobacteria bacterium]|nr:TRAP transporter small permease [Gammaproteobacteria bacterium]